MAIQRARIIRRDVATSWLLPLMMSFAIGVAGCGGNNGEAGVQGKPTAATGTSVIAVDCKRQRAFVPLPNLNPDGHGQVAVLDLRVDPDRQNAVLKVIDIGLVALPRAAAVDIKTGTVLVLVDNVVSTGTMLLIDETDDSLTTVPFPFGSRPAETSGVVIDSKNGTAVVSMSDSLFECTGGLGSCTGQASFDLASGSFGPLIPTLWDVDSFGVNPFTNTSISSSDPITPQLLALNLPGQDTCLLVDTNQESLNADPDGIAVDPSTNIWVAGNFQSPIASVINLRGATFEGSGTFTCSLNEGGTSPNSVNHDTGTEAAGMPGVAINPVTHQAFMTAQGGNQIALLSLPTAPVRQLSASKVKSVHSTIPNKPNGEAFSPANFPYGIAIDSCHNLGYVIDDDVSFLAQIDLARFKRNPSVISTPLPAGTCAGVTTAFQCDNGRGVKFFPLPGSSSALAQSRPAQFSTEAFKARKAAKNRGTARSHQ